MQIELNMIKVTLADIATLRKAGANFEIYLRPVMKRDAIWYAIDFMMIGAKGEKEEGQIMTVRNKEYIRSDMQKIIELLREHFPDTEQFSGKLYPDNYKPDKSE